ncbi:MAG: tetratricopeptide repeat protein [Pedobacter sp.]|nr:tetratricopeptide repeat protein [Pedobacter sp.]
MSSRFPALLLALILICAYAATPFASFQFDDFNVIVHNPHVHSLQAWWASLPGLRMLLKLSYALDWLTGTQAFSFHLTNLLLHIANTLLLFFWLQEFLQRAKPEQAADNNTIAFLATLFWCLHPAQTEAVTYIAGRSVSLMAFFCLAALLVQAKRPRYWQAWMAVFTLLALLTRETAWVLPFTLLFCEHFCAQRHQQSWQQNLKNTAPAFAVLLPGMAYFLLEPNYRQMLAFSFTLRDMPSQLLTQLAGWQYLLGPGIFSLTPNIDPDIALQSTLTPALLFMALLLAGMTLSGFFLLQRGHLAGLALLWLLLQLAPTNSIFPRVDVANDRHLYLALIGPALLAAQLLTRWQRPGLILAWLLAGLLFVSTLIRNADYQSELALWGRTVQQSPDKARPWNNLGQAALEAGNLELAQHAFSRAVELAPDDSRARLNLYFLKEVPPRP